MFETYPSVIGLRFLRTSFLETAAMLATCAAAMVSVACSTDSDRSGPIERGLAGSTVDVAAGKVKSGFAIGHLRVEQQVEAFRMMRHPVTSIEVSACVRAGACPQEASGCGWAAYEAILPYNLQGENSPESCPTNDLATAYCGWVGGRLPTLAEWLLAARGLEPARYSFGFPSGTGAEHPRTALMASGALALEIGTHPRGASPSGIEDVLLTPGELLSVDDDAQFASCRSPSKACIVHGISPGTIDAVQGYRDFTRETLAYSFRCVISE